VIRGTSAPQERHIEIKPNMSVPERTKQEEKSNGFNSVCKSYWNYSTEGLFVVAMCLTFPSCLTSSPLAWLPVLVDGQARGDRVYGRNGHMPNPKRYPPTPLCSWQNIFLNSLTEPLDCFYW